MAEHELCKLGVTGSNPVASTTRRACRGAGLLVAGHRWRGECLEQVSEANSVERLDFHAGV